MVLSIADAVTAIDDSTIVRANEIIGENRAWLNAHRSNIDTWIADYHKTRGEDATTVPTVPPTNPPTIPTTSPPTQAPPSSSTVITLSTFLMGTLIVVNLL